MSHAVHPPGGQVVVSAPCFRPTPGRRRAHCLVNLLEDPACCNQAWFRRLDLPGLPFFVANINQPSQGSRLC